MLITCCRSAMIAAHVVRPYMSYTIHMVCTIPKASIQFNCDLYFGSLIKNDAYIGLRHNMLS